MRVRLLSRSLSRRTSVPAKRKAPQRVDDALSAQAHALTAPSPDTWLWHDGHGAQMRSFPNVLVAVRAMMEAVPNCEVHVGTDSKLVARSDGRAVGGLARYKYVTAVCVRETGHGACYWHSRHSCVLPFASLDMRLWKEVENSMVVADCVCAHLRVPREVITVHADANADVRFKSARHTAMLIGIIKAGGYDFRIKPTSWATWVADRHCNSRR